MSTTIEPPAEPDYFVAELHLPTRPGTPPLAPMVLVAPGIGARLPDVTEDQVGEDGRHRRSMQACGTVNALRAAQWLVRWALAQTPERLMAVAERGELADLVDELWPLVRERAWELADPEAAGGSKLLRGYIQEQIRLRVEEEFAAQRRRSTEAGLNRVADIIDRLWNIAAEDNPAVRAAALPAIRSELAPFLRR